MRLLPALWLASVTVIPLYAADYPFQPVPFTQVRLTSGFWFARQEVNRTVTVPFALQQCEDSKRLRNFDLAAETMKRRAAGETSFQNQPPTVYPFDDTDVYKSIESASYVLSMRRDEALEKRLDEWIARIAAAQEPDGYLYTFRTMHPDSPAHKWIDAQRWVKDPELSHELYNCGHLYEAAVAHFQATGKRTLLDVALRNAELLWRDFGDRQRRIAPGHQIVEVGLVKLFRVTGEPRWLTLAQIFLDARGPGGPTYNQRHALVTDQTEAVGHAVRANYMYSGMADVATLTGDQRYFGAINRIWANAVGRKLYLTGGVGALAKGEAYGADYELPNDAYNETCAAVALMMWAHRMFLMTGEARYMDVFERTAYNGFLSGVSLSGDRFFYPNPLVHDGERKNNSGHAGRVPWFGCACCPPNVTRTLAAFTGYLYAQREDALYVNLFGSSEATATVRGTMVKLKQETNYPWDGKLRLAVDPSTPTTFSLKIRIPGWARGQPVPSDLYSYADAPALAAWSVRVADAPAAATLDDGYVTLTREWKSGDIVQIDLPMPVHRVTANSQVAALKGRVAFERGPFVYCVEDTDRAYPPVDIVADASVRAEAEYRPKLLGGVQVLRLEGATLGGTPLGPIAAIPYFAWNNRGLAPMAVWLRAE